MCALTEDGVGNTDTIKEGPASAHSLRESSKGNVNACGVR